MLTHWGLLENVRSMGHAMEATSGRVRELLPLYHDMGLIGACSAPAISVRGSM